MKGKILDIQPENREPFLYTHFDCWNDADDPEEEAWDPESKEAINFVENNLKKEWIEKTGINFSDIDYKSLGQVEFFNKAAERFAENGYDVYNGDNFFEVYICEPK